MIEKIIYQETKILRKIYLYLLNEIKAKKITAVIFSEKCQETEETEIKNYKLILFLNNGERKEYDFSTEKIDENDDFDGDVFDIFEKLKTLCYDVCISKLNENKDFFLVCIAKSHEEFTFDRFSKKFIGCDFFSSDVVFYKIKFSSETELGPICGFYTESNKIASESYIGAFYIFCETALNGWEKFFEMIKNKKHG